LNQGSSAEEEELCNDLGAGGERAYLSRRNMDYGITVAVARSLFTSNGLPSPSGGGCRREGGKTRQAACPCPGLVAQSQLGAVGVVRMKRVRDAGLTRTG
jgi:hypothetical protein